MAKQTQREKEQIAHVREVERLKKNILSSSKVLITNLRRLNKYWDSLTFEERVPLLEQLPPGFEFDDKSFWFDGDEEKEGINIEKLK